MEAVRGGLLKPVLPSWEVSFSMGAEREKIVIIPERKLRRLVEAVRLANELVADIRGSTPRRNGSRLSKYVPGKEELVRQLERHNGNVAAVARHFDRAPMQVRRWVRRYEIDLKEFRRR